MALAELSQGAITHEVCTLKGEVSLLFLFGPPALSFGCSTSARKDWELDGSWGACDSFLSPWSEISHQLPPGDGRLQRQNSISSYCLPALLLQKVVLLVLLINF